MYNSIDTRIKYVYYNKCWREVKHLVQRRKVEKKFKDNGWYFVRHGGNHDIWSNGKIKTQLPRHPKFSDKLYNALIRKFNLK